MARDNELIRQLLLYIEERETNAIRPIAGVTIEGYTSEQISHHIWLLGNGGYVTIKDFSNMQRICYRPKCLTWTGHELLDAIRDRDVWEKTLSVAKAGGVEAISALYEIAKKIAAKKLEQLVDAAA